MAKKQLSGFDLYAIKSTLNTLKGSFVHKIYQPDRGTVVFRLNVPRATLATLNGQGVPGPHEEVSHSSATSGSSQAQTRTGADGEAVAGKSEPLLPSEAGSYLRKDLVVVAGKSISLEDPKTMPAEPTAFARACRKYLTNARLTDVSQMGVDRILILRFEKGSAYQVILEFIPPGNVVLVSDGTILNVLFHQRWRTRDIRPHEPWVPPPLAFDITTASDDELAAFLKESKREIVRTLAVHAGMGGVFAEEICLRTGIDPSVEAAALEKEDIARLRTELSVMLKEASSAGAYLWHKSDSKEVVECTPIDLATLRARGLLPEEVQDIFTGLRLAMAAADAPVDQEKERLERLIRQQAEAIERFRAASEGARMAAELIYKNYQKVAEVISIVSEAVSRLGWDEVARRLHDRKDLRVVDPRMGTIGLKVEDTEIVLDVRATVNENAARHYEEAKRWQAKLDGAERALSDARGKLNAHVESTKAARNPDDTGPAPRTRRFWFEHYRWMFTSEGHLVIGGKDRRTNEKVVRRYLRPGDRYCHADVTGAPSCVIKSEGRQIPESSLHEACSFALIHSRAWHSKVGSGSAYWVTPDQVSKTPNAGEFVPKGAFIVRGRRHYFRNLPMRAAIGIINYRTERLVMCGPEEAVAAHAENGYLIIEPGDDNEAPRIAAELEVPVDEVQRVLPPGPSRIVDHRGMEAAARRR